MGNGVNDLVNVPPVVGRAADLAVELHAHTLSSQRNAITGENDNTQPLETVNQLEGGNGVHGVSSVPGGAGVLGVNHNDLGSGITGYSKRGTGVIGIGGANAGLFKGNVTVTGMLW